jgi:hypothetical protein
VLCTVDRLHAEWTVGRQPRRQASRSLFKKRVLTSAGSLLTDVPSGIPGPGFHAVVLFEVLDASLSWLGTSLTLPHWFACGASPI